MTDTFYLKNKTGKSAFLSNDLSSKPTNRFFYLCFHIIIAVFIGNLYYFTEKAQKSRKTA